ncbi:uncharacterized protein KY384_005950 [Bacidia gigantensis]|uniref:uncharacterized protein n=1 Tax=Bacidia gigantensis TaxID=2732470 RepID=UPI001D053FD3|nr:uncharacterized protein KY384_005950 [Bacidia gigantensis]KAG8529314.1 hypothetical protein KY384_005950 [Bacidia gigantensis]
MAPKNAKPSKGKPKPQEEQREGPLQAIVLADSFETRFRPFTLDTPRCLLPLANTPIIEYTLEFLASNGVQEVFVYCGNHTDQLEEYINISRWKRSSSPFQSLTLIKTTATSVGDCMRDLDNRDLVTGDFLVVSGDVVSNVNLASALSRHRSRKGKDKNAIMTMVLREEGSGKVLRSRRRKPVFVLDPKTERCLHYEELSSTDGDRHVMLDPDSLTSHLEIEIREDLVDPHIDICTPDVLALWTENFDYQSLRRSFLFGVLKDHELNGKTVHAHILSDHFAARVASLKAYDAITRHVLSKRTYPFCPDSNLLTDQTYQSREGRLYQEQGVQFGMTSKISGRCAFGAGTSIGEKCLILNSTVGRRCNIENNVTLENTFVWDDVQIRDSARIEGPTIIAGAVTIQRSAVISPGATIAFKSNIEGSKTVGDIKVRSGENGSQNTKGLDNDSDTSNNLFLRLPYKNSSAASSQSSISTFAASEDEFEPRDSSRRSSFRSDPSDETAQNRDFQIEATASILDGLTKGDAADTIFLELNGYRMSVDASQHEVRHAVVVAFVRHVFNITESISLRDAIQQVISDYKSLFRRIILDETAEQKSDQVDLLLIVQKELVGRPKGDQVLLFIAKEMYDQDVIEEEGVLQWWEDEKSSAGEMGQIRGLTEPFITYLEEAEEAEDSGEDEMLMGVTFGGSLGAEAAWTRLSKAGVFLMSDTSRSDTVLSNSELERALQDAVRNVYKREDLGNLTVKRIRKAVEEQLDLEVDFFKNHIDWKDRSKDVIQSEVDAHNENIEGSRGQRASPTDADPLPPPVKSSPKNRGTKRASSELAEAKPRKKQKSIPKVGSSLSERESKPKDTVTKSHNRSPRADLISSQSEANTDLEAPKPNSNGAKAQDSESDMSVLLDEPKVTKKKKRQKSESKPKINKSNSASKPMRISEATVDPDNEEIKRLQGWLVKCGIRKMWFKELAPHDTPKAKIKHLRVMLSDAGMEGRYSKEKADQIREERELKADLEAVQAGNKAWGNDHGQEVDDEADRRPKRRIAKGLQGLDFLNDDDGEETD